MMQSNRSVCLCSSSVASHLEANYALDWICSFTGCAITWFDHMMCHMMCHMMQWTSVDPRNCWTPVCWQCAKWSLPFGWFCLLHPTGMVLQGRLTLMMGPPGGGKSTLLQLLAGMLAGHAIKVCLLFLESVSCLCHCSWIAVWRRSMAGDCWLGFRCYKKTSFFWVVSFQVCRFAGWLAEWLLDCFSDWLVDRLIYCWINWLINCTNVGWIELPKYQAGLRWPQNLSGASLKTWPFHPFLCPLSVIRKAWLCSAHAH